MTTRVCLFQVKVASHVGCQPSVPGRADVEFHSGQKFRFKIAVAIAAQYIVGLRMAEFRHYRKKDTAMSLLCAGRTLNAFWAWSGLAHGTSCLIIMTPGAVWLG